jgi:hypothetical protein
LDFKTLYKLQGGELGKMKKEIAFTFLLIGMASAAAAQTTAQDTDINVSVSGTTELDVRPTQLNYTTALEPGVQASPSDEENGYSAVEIENIGSNNISQVYVEASQPTTNPFGTGTTSSYDSGNFVMVNTNSSVNGDYGTAEGWDTSLASGVPQNYHYVNRVEFEDDPIPSYIDLAQSNTPLKFSNPSTLEADVGRFREGDQWYFYTIYYDGSTDAAACSGGNSELWVGNDPHTPTATGTTDFTDQSNADVYGIESAQGSVGVTNQSVGLEVENSTGGTETVEYDVYTYCDGREDNLGATMRSKFNVDPDFSFTPEDDISAPSDGDDGSVAILDATGAANPAAENLNPGSYFPLDVTVKLPQGVPAGDIDGGQITLQSVAQS